MSGPARDIPDTGERDLNKLDCPDARPISDKDREECLQAFIQATFTTLAEMAEVVADVREVYATSTPRSVGDITVVLGLTPTPGAMLVLDFPGPTASALANRVLAEAGGTSDDDLVRDCMAELTNVIAGQAKALLHGTSHAFAFSTPKIMSKRDLLPGTDPGREFLIVMFASDAGDFTLQLCPVESVAEGG
jgi:chemotaxis protein CheX